ncbi:MAG: (d)CMP kinase [Clostridia bacterium]|nr:(d)CMP kinase [Clostridia bacterium]
MGKRNIITLAGDLASGKGTVSTLICDELGYEVYRNGNYFRELAKKMGMDVTSFNVYVKSHPEIDRQIEKSAAEYAQSHDNLVIDARLGWYAVPDSFKVYLRVDLDVAAMRALNDPNRKDSENFTTFEDQKADMKRRFELENERYFNIYGIHKEDLSNYDYVLDTTNLKPEEVKDKIIAEYKKWLEV